MAEGTAVESAIPAAGSASREIPFMVAAKLAARPQMGKETGRLCGSNTAPVGSVALGSPKEIHTSAVRNKEVSDFLENSLTGHVSDPTKYEQASQVASVSYEVHDRL